MGVIIQTVSRSCCFIFFLLSFPRNSIVINSDLITMCHTMAAVRSLQNDLSAGESTNTQSANVSKWKQFDSHWWPTEITTRIICHYFCTCAWDSCQPVCILNGGCTLPPLSILIEVKSKAEIELMLDILTCQIVFSYLLYLLPISANIWCHCPWL